MNAVARFLVLVLVALLIGPIVTFGFQEQPTAGQQTADTDRLREQVASRMVEEMHSLIPGNYSEDSDEMGLLNSAAELFINGQQPKVREQLEKLAENDPNVPPHELLMAGMCFASNNIRQGRSLLELAGVRHRNHPGIFLGFGRLALLESRYFEAHTLIQNAKDLADASSLSADAKRFYNKETLNSLTVIEMRRNELGKASEWARQWEALDPNNDDMLLVSSEIEFRNKNYEPAKSILDRRSDEMQKQLPSEIVMAKWFRSVNDFKNLESWVTKAYQVDPANSAIQLEYAAWLLRKSKYEKANEVVGKYEASNGETLDSISLKGRIAFGIGDYDAAAEQFGNIFQSQPSSLENSSLYTFALLETKATENHQQAFALAQRNYQAYPNSQLAILAMSRAIAKAGNSQASQQLLQRASRAGPVLPDTAYFMAKELKANGRDIQAIRTLDPFLSKLDMFLYRELAAELIKSMGASTSELPQPRNGNGG